MIVADLERFFLIAAIFLHGASAIALIIGVVFAGERWQSSGQALLWAGFLSCTALIAVHWQLVGHGPYISRYEVLLSNVWVATAAYLGAVRLWPGLRAMGMLVVPLILLGMGAASLSSAAPVFLSPAQRSTWLIIHVCFAKLTTGAILLGTGLALSVLLRARPGLERFSFLQRLPDPDRSDLLGYKMMVCAFLFASMMIASGSIWGHQLRQSYWDWDPLETWSLILWLVYGLYLHLRITFNFRGRKSAWFVIGAFVVTIFTFFLLPYLADTWHNAYMTN